MSSLQYIDRRNTNSEKWDGLTEHFGEDGLHAMWVADMDFKVPACVQEALSSYVEMGAFGYMKIPETYYDACIRWEKKHHGLEIKKEWIRFSPGVVSGFNWIIRFMTDKGDAVIVTTPVYYPFLRAVENNQRILITSELVNNHGYYTVDFDDFEKKIIDNNVKVFILCSPHNPVSRVWKRKELEKLMAICRKHGVFVIADEIHHDLVFDDAEHIPTLNVGDYSDMLITLIAPSKTFNLAGAQNSIVIIADEKLRRKWDTYTNEIQIVSGNSFGYVACEAAYSGGEEWYQDVKRQIFSNYEYLRDTFRKRLPNIVVTPLEGTYLCWIDLRAYVDPENIKEFIQEKCRLAIDYGEWFGGGQFRGFIRMNLATSKENVRVAVETICKTIDH